MKIKLFILGLVFACLGLTSFSSAGNFEYVGTVMPGTAYYVANSMNVGDLYCLSGTIVAGSEKQWSEGNGQQVIHKIKVKTDINNDFFACGILEYNYFVSNFGNYDIYKYVDTTCSSCPTCPSVPSGGSCSNTGSISEILDDLILYSGSVNLNNSSYTNIFNYGNDGAGTYCVKLTSTSPQTLTFGFANGGSSTPTNLYSLYNDQYDNYVCLYGNKPYFNAKLNSSSNTVNYEVYKLTDLYSHDICIEDSQECPSCEDCSTCQGSLGACLEDNTSLENMNSSLQDQLSQCLASGGTSCDPELDEDCYTGAYQLFHIFRQNQGSDFSLPISNNIFLPNGLRAYTDSGVVALAPLTPSDYSLDHESGEILNDLVIKIFYYLAVLLSVMALAYYIKKFLSFTLFPKKD